MTVPLRHFPIAKKWSQVQQKMIISAKKRFHLYFESVSLEGQKNGHIVFPKCYPGRRQSMLEVPKRLTGYYCIALALFQKSRTQTNS
jgi:hypothetical protein